MQNKLDELWALLNFLMPALFGSSEDFQRWFGADCCLEEEEVLLVTSRLHQILRPFMLRRLKETVASELPRKAGTSSRLPTSSEITLCVLSPSADANVCMTESHVTLAACCDALDR